MIDIEKLERAYEASTQGEWAAFDDVQMLKIGSAFYDLPPADIRFVAAAHAHLSALLAELRAARAERIELDKFVASYGRCGELGCAEIPACELRELLARLDAARAKAGAK